MSKDLAPSGEGYIAFLRLYWPTSGPGQRLDSAGHQSQL